MSKSKIYLILSIVFGALTIAGAYISIPMIIKGYMPHEPDELNGLIALFGFIFFIPTFLAGGLCALLASKYSELKHKMK